ncbi:unnamed protein product [Lactuca virosa]|uniref:Uncharacterized protein n=1 Tax=Lactuca virosa TaxID=75947 RepID=A0AAU9MWV2_9ASTR|nr:unnamed protein product [Lactuca virosa]
MTIGVQLTASIFDKMTEAMLCFKEFQVDQENGNEYGASASSFWYNLRVQHPCREVPILDYDLALLFQPMLMLRITFGVALSVVFPYWLITVLIIILFLGTSSRSFFRGIEMWKEESNTKGLISFGVFSGDTVVVADKGEDGRAKKWQTLLEDAPDQLPYKQLIITNNLIADLDKDTYAWYVRHDAGKHASSDRHMQQNRHRPPNNITNQHHLLLPPVTHLTSLLMYAECM